MLYIAIDSVGKPQNCKTGIQVFFFVKENKNIKLSPEISKIWLKILNKIYALKDPSTSHNSYPSDPTVMWVKSNKDSTQISTKSHQPLLTSLEQGMKKTQIFNANSEALP